MISEQLSDTQNIFLKKETPSTAILHIVADVKGYALQHNIPFDEDHTMLLMNAMNILINYKDESNPLRRYDGSTII